MARAEGSQSLLQPPENVQRILLSTTSRFVGAFETEEARIDHAWPGFHSDAHHRWQDGPTSRSTYVLSFLADGPEHRVGTVVPDYSAAGDFVASLLSVLFGKRVESHGSLENCGAFGMPDVSAFSTTSIPHLPHNAHKPRADFGMPLNLVEVARLKPLWSDVGADKALANGFSTAARFYQRGLISADRDPEIAYLHMITAAEVLAQLHLPKSDDRLLDDELEAELARMTEALKDKGRLARMLRKRLFEVKRRFVTTFVDLVDDDFFDRREAAEPFAALQRTTFAAAIGAAYDLRSLNVHQGRSTGRWMRLGGHLNEIQLGRPIVDEKDLAKALADAPTLVGLERVTRYALLRFAQSRLSVNLD